VDALAPEEMQNVYQSFNLQGNLMADAEYQLMEMREAMMAEVESQRQQMLLELNSHQSASSQQNQLERQQMQQMVNEMREKTLKQEALIQAMQKNLQDNAQQGPGNAAVDRSEQMSEAGVSTVLGATPVPVQFPTVVCKCGEPAMKLLVKKWVQHRAGRFGSAPDKSATFSSGIRRKFNDCKCSPRPRRAVQ
jgi:hypothetical protein